MIYKSLLTTTSNNSLQKILLVCSSFTLLNVAIVKDFNLKLKRQLNLSKMMQSQQLKLMVTITKKQLSDSKLMDSLLFSYSKKMELSIPNSRDHAHQTQSSCGCTSKLILAPNCSPLLRKSHKPSTRMIVSFCTSPPMRMIGPSRDTRSSATFTLMSHLFTLSSQFKVNSN